MFSVVVEETVRVEDIQVEEIIFIMVSLLGLQVADKTKNKIDPEVQNMRIVEGDM